MIITEVSAQRHEHWRGRPATHSHKHNPILWSKTDAAHGSTEAHKLLMLQYCAFWKQNVLSKTRLFNPIKLRSFSKGRVVLCVPLDFIDC